MLIDNHLDGRRTGRDIESQVPVSLFDVRIVAVDGLESLWRAKGQAVGAIANDWACEASALHRLWGKTPLCRLRERRWGLPYFSCASSCLMCRLPLMQ